MQIINYAKVAIEYKAHEYSWDEWCNFNAEIQQVYGKIIDDDKVDTFRKENNLTFDEVWDAATGERSDEFLTDEDDFHMILNIPNHQQGKDIFAGYYIDKDGFGTSFNTSTVLSSAEEMQAHFKKISRLGNGCGDEFRLDYVKQFKLNPSFVEPKQPPLLSAEDHFSTQPNNVEPSSIEM